MITNLRKSKKTVRQPLPPTGYRRRLSQPWLARFFSIFPIFLAIGLIVFLVITNWKINQKRFELQQRIEALKKEIQILEEKTAALRAGIAQIENEDYLVKRAQEQGYFEEGATPVVVLPAKENATNKEKEKSPWNPQSWWEWLKSKIGQ
jgi:cell division protein FtsB